MKPREALAVKKTVGGRLGPPNQAISDVGFTPFDAHLFTEGTHSRLYRKLGAHSTEEQGVQGVRFSVWAPNAERVCLGGDFNGWAFDTNPLAQTGAGVWSGFFSGIENGAAYQYCVTPRGGGEGLVRPDPFAARLEGAPRHASHVWGLDYDWGDGAWLRERKRQNWAAAPVSIYRLKLASWRRVPEQGHRWLTYMETARFLVEHLRRAGFTHAQFSPAQPAAWFPKDEGVAGLYAADSRFGSPRELMGLIDALHQEGFGVILEWNPNLFPSGPGGLELFDGTPSYEAGFQPGDPPRAGVGFNLERPEVRSYLLSSAMYWLDAFHADGLRVATGPLLRHQGEAASNAVGLLGRITEATHSEFPGALAAIGGLDGGNPGVSHLEDAEFDLVKDEGFGESTPGIFERDYDARLARQQWAGRSADSSCGAARLLELPGDDVRRSLFGRMAGDEWQRAANYKLMLGWQWLQQGKKSIFMGTEFGQRQPWNPLASLDWHLLDHHPHGGILRWMEDLNRLYCQEPGLHRDDLRPREVDGLADKIAHPGVAGWMRHEPKQGHELLIMFNLTPVVHRNFFVGVRRSGYWRELLNSDSREYGGTEQGNLGGVRAAPFPTRGLPRTLTLTLPPLAVLVFKHSNS